MKMIAVSLALALALLADGAAAADFEARVVSGTVQLGGRLVIALDSDEKPLPEAARCALDLPVPYAEYVTVVSDDCRAFTLQGDAVPIRDDAGYAIPSAEVPYTLIATGPDGAEAGRIAGSFPYSNQFTDIRVVIEGVKNPVSPEKAFRFMCSAPARRSTALCCVAGTPMARFCSSRSRGTNARARSR